MESFIYFCNEKEVERFAHAVQGGFALCHACAVSVTTVEFFRLLLY